MCFGRFLIVLDKCRTYLSTFLVSCFNKGFIPFCHSFKFYLLLSQKLKEIKVLLNIFNRTEKLHQACEMEFKKYHIGIIDIPIFCK
jgi:hypothetical protein